MSLRAFCLSARAGELEDGDALYRRLDAKNPAAFDSLACVEIDPVALRQPDIHLFDIRHDRADKKLRPEHVLRLETLRRVEERLHGVSAPVKVAVMGCVVNGPGEARDADIGVACGAGKGALFVGGEVVRTVPEEDIVEELMKELERL